MSANRSLEKGAALQEEVVRRSSFRFPLVREGPNCAAHAPDGTLLHRSNVMPSACALGFHCSHEQLPPSTLLRLATLADEAGFGAAMCSDHFHPWSERQGHSGYAWSWLGAALQTTRMSFGTVCAPGQRYHPAVIAQAAATLSEMFPDRFWIAVGSGEALNESITGHAWQPKQERHLRLIESVEIIRGLWAGAEVTKWGTVVTKAARLYSRPAILPRLFGAALTPETARWVGSWADGLITAAGPRDDMRRVVEAFRESAGDVKPMFLQATVSFAPTDEEAARAAHDQWRHCALPVAHLADLPSTAAFDRATANSDARAVLSTVRASSDIGRHLGWLHQDHELGFERIYLHNVAREHQERFIEACAEQVIPVFQKAEVQDRTR
jgi:coenzyme F420-dependent glucose-6-phosphate dehydrogenase